MCIRDSFEGWPIGSAELAPWYAEAREVCELGPADDDVAAWMEAAGARALPLDERRLRTAMFHLSGVASATHFADAYGEELRRAERVAVCLHANALGLEIGGGQAKRRARAASSGPPSARKRTRSSSRPSGTRRGRRGSRRRGSPGCLLYTSPSPRDLSTSRMPSSA